MLTRRQILALPAAAILRDIRSEQSESVVSFEAFWRNHPMGEDKGEGVKWPCENLVDRGRVKTAGDLVTNQCAVRMGVCLRKTLRDIAFAMLPDVVCTNGNGQRQRPQTCRDISRDFCAHSTDEWHFLHANELGQILSQVTTEFRTVLPQFSCLRRAEEFTKGDGIVSNFRNAIGNRNGIIYIENYWVRKNGERTGSHIDLWRGALQRTKNDCFYKGRTGPIDRRYDEMAGRILFWEIAG